MLSVFEAVRQRRSIRRFKSQPIPREMIVQMLEAARLAPSASNRQPWRFVVVSRDEEKKRLRQLCLDQAFIEEAPIVFVVCADPSAYSKEASNQRYQEFIQFGVELAGRFADPEFRRLAQSLPEPDPRTIATSVIANTYIATEHLVLMATALGLGSCWVGALTDHAAIRALLSLPDHIILVALIAVGYPASLPSPRPRLPLEAILLRPLPET